MSARDDSGIVNCQGPCHQVFHRGFSTLPIVNFQGNWQIKRVSSKTGPYKESVLSDAIRLPETVISKYKVIKG